MINGWPLRVNLVITAIFSLQKLIFGVFRCGTFLHAINKPNSNVPSKLRACAHGFSTSAHRIFLLAYNRYVTNVTAHEAGQCAHSEIKLEMSSLVTVSRYITFRCCFENGDKTGESSSSAAFVTVTITTTLTAIAAALFFNKIIQ